MRQDSHLSFSGRISPCKDRQAKVGTWTVSKIERIGGRNERICKVCTREFNPKR